MSPPTSRSAPAYRLSALRLRAPCKARAKAPHADGLPPVLRGISLMRLTAIPHAAHGRPSRRPLISLSVPPPRGAACWRLSLPCCWRRGEAKGRGAYEAAAISVERKARSVGRSCSLGRWIAGIGRWISWGTGCRQPPAEAPRGRCPLGAVLGRSQALAYYFCGRVFIISSTARISWAS